MLTEKELLRRVRAVIDPKMDEMGLEHAPHASDLLRRCLMREYEAGHWKMRNPGNPFYANAWFNVAANYNEPDEFVTPDGIAERIETFKHRMLPTEYDIDRRFTDNVKDRYAVAAYPRCSIFTLNGAEHVRHSYAMVYFCASNPPDDMDWQPEGRSFPQSENREIEVRHDTQGQDETAREEGEQGRDDGVRGDDLGGAGSSGRASLDNIFRHIEKAKATQPVTNAGHHMRWDHVTLLIKSNRESEAREYAKQWAGKGWQPWKELVGMLS